MNQSKNAYAGWIITIIIALVITLPFHYVFYTGDFMVFPKNQITFSNTILTDEDINELVKRYNNSSIYEKQAMDTEPLIRKLREKGILVEKKFFDSENNK